MVVRDLPIVILQVIDDGLVRTLIRNYFWIRGTVDQLAAIHQSFELAFDFKLLVCDKFVILFSKKRREKRILRRE
jgi:hypothetical protein